MYDTDTLIFLRFIILNIKIHTDTSFHDGYSYKQKTAVSKQK